MATKRKRRLGALSGISVHPLNVDCDGTDDIRMAACASFPAGCTRAQREIIGENPHGLRGRFGLAVRGVVRAHLRLYRPF